MYQIINKIGESEFVNAINVLIRNQITTMKEFQQLTEEDIQDLYGAGVKKLENIMILKRQTEIDDIFDCFHMLQIKPNSNEKFFKTQHINAFNILSKKLFILLKEVKMSGNRINAFIDYKNTLFRVKYNNTLQEDEQFVESDFRNKLVDLCLQTINQYISEDQQKSLRLQLIDMIGNINFEQVGNRYYKEIAELLDYEFILSNETENFEKELLYQVILNERKEINNFILKQKLQNLKIFDMNLLDTCLKELVKDGFVQYTQFGMKINFPTAFQYMSQYKEEKFPNMYLRLQGKTLEEIGGSKGVTRERIRQKCKSEISKIPLDKLYESKLKVQFELFDLSEEEFCDVFMIEKEQYSFLKYVYKQQDIKIQKEYLLEDIRLSIEEKERVLSIIDKGFMYIDNHRIRINKISLVGYAVGLFAKDTIRINDFQDKLIQFCQENELDNIFEFNDLRALEGIVLRLDTILWKYGKSFRYYNVDKELVQSSLQQINFDRYLNQEITTRVIMRDYEEIFERLEICDEYELHNLLYRNEQYLPQNVKCIRMPGVEIGVVDREEQILNFLIEKSPIDKEKYIELYSEKYGMAVDTFKANYSVMLREYEVDGVLNADTPFISKDILDNLRSILKDNFYFKEDIYQMYKNQFGEIKLFDYIYPLVGYKNFSQFILTDKYNRIDLFLENEYFQHDIFKLNDNRIKYIGSFVKKYLELRGNLEIFEFAPNEFISFNLINSKLGISKEEISQFISTVLDEVGDKYFTISMIEPIIEQSKLYQLGFEDIFYESLLKGEKSLRYQIMGGTIVFRKIEDKFYMQDFIEEVVTRFQQIDIYDLMDYLHENYSVDISKSKLIQTTENSNLYYHPVMEVIYQDREKFYEILEGK